MTTTSNTREQAKKDLENMGIKFSEEVFLSACRNGNKDIVELFIKGGINVNAEQHKEENQYFGDGQYAYVTVRTSALEFALNNRHKEIVTMLILNGADFIFLSESPGWGNLLFPSVFALLGNKEFKKILEGIDINKKNMLLNLIVSKGSYYIDSKEIIELLLSVGADINGKYNYNNETPLHMCSYDTGEKKEEFYKLLIDKGADVNAKDNKGETPLYSALRSNNIIANLLITNGADVNVENNNGETPLHIASAYYASSTKEVFIMLLNKGADVNKKDNEGRTPIRIAIGMGNQTRIGLLRAAGAKEEDILGKD